MAKVAQRFGGVRLTLVGDRGMIRGPQIAALVKDFGYITAITKAQIETWLGGGLLQMSLFDTTVSEVLTAQGVRYVWPSTRVGRRGMARMRTSIE